MHPNQIDLLQFFLEFGYKSAVFNIFISNMKKVTCCQKLPTAKKIDEKVKQETKKFVN